MKIQTSEKSDIRFSGEGPGHQTIDGCSIDFYLLLRAEQEPEIISQVIKDNSSVLELGCGVGRITHPLLERGYSVTAVDNSIEMLSHVKGADLVCSDIETLELEHKFDTVLLLSYLINIPSVATRKRLLDTCRNHCLDDGVILIQLHPLSTLNNLDTGYKGECNGIETYLDYVKKIENVIDLELRWKTEDKEWKQRFSTEILDQARIEKTLTASGLKFVRWLDEKCSWVMAKKTTREKSD